MRYTNEKKEYCCDWVITWNFHMESFVKDGESSGFGRFVRISDNKVIIQLWFVGSSIKIEQAEGYFVQMDYEQKIINVLEKE